MKSLSLLIAVLILFLSPRYGHFFNNNPILNTDTASSLTKKQAVDKYLKTHQKEIITMAKVPGKKKLMPVFNNKWLDEVEYSYNILKNKSGRIIFIMQSPFSESGDWDIEYHHYFDDNGKTYAFSREESLFCNVKGGILRELALKYYDNNFKNIGTIVQFMDVNFKPVKIKKELYDFRDEKYSIYKNLNDCLTAYNIEP